MIIKKMCGFFFLLRSSVLTSLGISFFYFGFSFLYGFSGVQGLCPMLSGAVLGWVGQGHAESGRAGLGRASTLRPPWRCHGIGRLESDEIQEYT